jgi:pteridine reductase
LALVTGGSRRIGAAIARHLHARGFDIALHYRSSATEAASLSRELCALRADSCRHYRADLGDPADIDTLAAALLAQGQGLDLLVNNASDFYATPLGATPATAIEPLLASNLSGPWLLVQALLPGLAGRRGNVVNITDVHAEHPLRGYSLYCAAKAGLASLTRSLALELAPAIRVNAVAPGAILWPDDEADYDAAAREATVAATPLARLGEPEDIARAVAFLACEAPFVTGQVLAVDGGRTLAG